MNKMGPTLIRAVQKLERGRRTLRPHCIDIFLHSERSGGKEYSPNYLL